RYDAPGRSRERVGGHAAPARDEACLCRPGDAPTDDAPGEDVDDERHVNEALPGGHIGVSRPEESHLRPLAEPDVSLLAHPAPAIRPMTETPVTNERTHPVAFAPAAREVRQPEFYGLPTS